MNQERLMKLLLSPVISEKAALAAESSAQYAFRVAPDATKREIGRAVEVMFDVKVDRVQVMNLKGKNKRFGAVMGHRSGARKAYVRLAEGNDIDFGAGA